jgi:hypothetical protein
MAGDGGMFERSGNRTSTVVGLVTLLVVVGAIAYDATNDDEQREVAVQSGNPLPERRAIDREDDHGADTVRAYLQAAVNCDAAGRDLMARLSRVAPEQAGVLCRRKEATARVDDDDAVWVVDAGAGDELRLVLARREGSWEIVGP